VYLNFGVIFGKCKDFIEMYKIMEMKDGYDDQGTISLRIKDKQFSKFAIDYNHEVFATLFEDPTWNASDKKYYTKTNMFPSFIHFPGKNGSYEPCVKQLFEACNITDSPVL
jgi:hypothetical protein